MRKRALLVSAVALIAVLVAGGLFASNMGFKLNYSMERSAAATADGASRTGLQWVALPYNQQTNLINANDLILDIGGTSIIAQVAQYVRSGDIPAAYTGLTGSAFTLTPGDAYYIGLQATALPSPYSYIVVGSHNPGLGINMLAQSVGVSRTGQNLWSYPYHSTAANAKQIIDELNAFGGAGTVNAIARYGQSGDIPVAYTGLTGTAFSMLPGDGYLVQVNANVTGWVPSHY